MSEHLNKSQDSATAEEVAGEQVGLVEMLIDQNKRTLELLQKQQAENKDLTVGLEKATHPANAMLSTATPLIGCILIIAHNRFKY